MKKLSMFAFAAAALLMAAVPVKADELAKDAAVTAYSGTIAGLSLAGMKTTGPVIGLGAFATIAYCHSQVKRDAAGYVTYQAPECGGGGPVVVGSTTANPYNKVGKKCVPVPGGGYDCEN